MRQDNGGVKWIFEKTVNGVWSGWGIYRFAGEAILLKLYAIV